MKQMASQCGWKAKSDENKMHYCGQGHRDTRMSNADLAETQASISKV